MINWILTGAKANKITMIYQILVVASQEVAALQLNHDQLCTDQATGELAEPLNMVEFTLKNMENIVVSPWWAVHIPWENKNYCVPNIIT
jgi:hypothetical protein